MYEVYMKNSAPFGIAGQNDTPPATSNCEVEVVGGVPLCLLSPLGIAVVLRTLVKSQPQSRTASVVLGKVLQG